MTCPAAFTISDGTTTATIIAAGVSETFAISREVVQDGLAPFRSAAGTAWVDVRFRAYRYTISGAGPASPGFYALSLNVASWTVVIPGFADGSANETWYVVPNLPVQTKDRRTGLHSWTLTLDSAVVA